MFAGHGAELLWRPAERRWALGVSADLAWRREPGTALVEPGAFRTGFLSLYGEWTAGIEAALHLGRYLGGDAGATLELSRELEGGLRLTAWGTRTTALRGALGVGLALPLWRPLPWASLETEAAVLPLTQDAGQRLDQKLPLYRLTSPAPPARVTGGWGRVMD
jgi:hypothetical protein